MDTHNTLASVRVNGREPASWAGADKPDSSALGRADRLATMGQLAAGLAHEMNTPLGSISAHAEESLQLLDAVQEGHLTGQKMNDLRGRLLAIMRQANRCSRIATRLLQFAQNERPAGGKCQPEQVVKEVVELFNPSAQEKSVHLDYRLAANLPDAPVGSAELEQLLINLVQNGLDACERGGLVRIEVDVREGQLHLVVVDTGCGIPVQALHRIFDPFFTTKPIGSGTGLGLSVCHGIVRSVAGSIEVESAPGRGTRVSVLLPIEPHTFAGVRVHEACPLGIEHTGSKDPKEAEENQ